MHADEPNNPSSEQPSIYHQDRNQPLYENPAGPHQGIWLLHACMHGNKFHTVLLYNNNLL